MRKTMIAAAAAATLLWGTAGVATAAPVTVSLTGSMVDNGTYGNAVTFNKGSTTLPQLQVTGWQYSKTTGKVTSAYVGAYSPGLGVTGLGDANGASGYHQIDNSGDYIDFVLLQFDRAVSISSVYLNSYQLGSQTTLHNDFDVAAVSTPQASWTSLIDLGKVTPSILAYAALTDNGKASGEVATAMTTYSNQWIISSAFDASGDDGFKIRSLNVNIGAVPEPATWGTMILGMGLVGGVLRRRRAAAAAIAA